jgi:hypothetical protein
MMLVYGGLLLVEILALLGIVLLLRETKPPTSKARAQEPSIAVPASATQADPILQDTQISEKIVYPRPTVAQAEDKMEHIGSSNMSSLPSNVTSVQPLPRNDITPLVTRSTGIVLSTGQFGALLSELDALRQRSEEMAERLEIVSETLEQLTPTQIEFPAISFKPSSAPDTPSAHRGRQFIN